MYSLLWKDEAAGAGGDPLGGNQSSEQLFLLITQVLSLHHEQQASEALNFRGRWR